METALAQELVMKSERQERLLKNLWTQKRDKMSKVNSKLKKELNKGRIFFFCLSDVIIKTLFMSQA